MKTLPTIKSIKNRVCALLIGVALTLTTASASHAMPSFMSLSIEPEWPATSSPGNVLLYKVSAVVREGPGLLEVSLSSLGLPDGATVKFSPSLLRFTGNQLSNQTAIMTVTCTQLTPLDSYPFTVTGTALRGAITMVNQVQPELYSPIVAPPLLAIDRLSEGGLRLRGKGTTGRTYQIESTPTLTNPDWTPEGSSTADGNGRFTFCAAQPANASVRFYRAVALAP
jgi:hypothetical protein